jgi:hypothetical protein
MLRRLQLSFYFLVLLLPLAAAFAQSFNGRNIVYGTVITATGCHNRFTVYTRNGYSIIEFLGGQPVIENDQLDGDMETVGVTLLMNKTRHGNVKAYVEMSRLSLSRFQSERQVLCR